MKITERLHVYGPSNRRNTPENRRTAGSHSILGWSIGPKLPRNAQAPRLPTELLIQVGDHLADMGARRTLGNMNIASRQAHGATEAALAPLRFEEKAWQVRSHEAIRQTLQDIIQTEGLPSHRLALQPDQQVVPLAALFLNASLAHGSGAADREESRSRIAAHLSTLPDECQARFVVEVMRREMSDPHPLGAYPDLPFLLGTQGSAAQWQGVRGLPAELQVAPLEAMWDAGVGMRRPYYRALLRPHIAALPVGIGQDLKTRAAIP